MSVNKNSPSYMKNYLKYALEFEKYVFIWSKALDIANKKMQSIYTKRSKLESEKASAEHKLRILQSPIQQQTSPVQNNNERYAKNAKKAIRVLIIGLIGLFALGCIVATLLIKLGEQDAMNDAPALYVIIIGFSFIILFSWVFIIPCGAVYLYSKSKISNYIPKQYTSSNSDIRQKALTENQHRTLTLSLEKLNAEENAVSAQQQEIFSMLTAAKKQLQEIYNENVLPYIYRNIGAVATMYEYLATGRCNTIQGHGGIYDTYEVEKIQIEQLIHLSNINSTLERIEDNQRYIYRELQIANNTLSQINSSLTEIKEINTEIAKNTAISAAANQQTAAATQWLAYRAWANGY